MPVKPGLFLRLVRRCCVTRRWCSGRVGTSPERQRRAVRMPSEPPGGLACAVVHHSRVSQGEIVLMIEATRGADAVPRGQIRRRIVQAVGLRVCFEHERQRAAPDAEPRAV